MGSPHAILVTFSSRISYGRQRLKEFSVTMDDTRSDGGKRCKVTGAHLFRNFNGMCYMCAVGDERRSGLWASL